MHKRKMLAVVGASVLATAMLAGCSSDGSGGTEGDGQVTIGYSAYTLSNPYFAGLLAGLERGAEEHGYEVVTANGNNDVAKQVSDIQDLILKGVDYILMTPADPKALGPAIAAADAAGIPIISVTDSVEQPITSTILSDNVAIGEQAAEQVVAYLEEKNGSAKGNVANIEGIAGAPAAVQRSEGFASVLAEYPDIKIVATADGGFDTEKSNAVMSDILQANPDIDAVFGANDSAAIGVLAAIRNANLLTPVGSADHIFVIGADGTRPALDAIRANELDATISQQPIRTMEEAVALIADLEAGKAVDELIFWPAQLITPANIDSEDVVKYGLWADEIE